MPITNLDTLSIYQEVLYVDNFITEPQAILGDFSNKICLVIDAPSNNEVSLNLLQNMMKACKIELSQTAVYSFENPTETITKVFKLLKPEVLLCFGVPFENEMMHLHIRKNDIIEMAGCKFLSTVNLQTLQSTPAEKTALWQSLQKLFNLI
jgi:DNA polymerase III psi subunit